MSRSGLTYTGERLVPGDERLSRLLVEDLSKFRFAGRYVAGKRVLDAGCGAGQGTAHLAAQGAAYVVGVDVALEAVGFARQRWQRPNLAFALMDGAHLSFAESSFDCVTSIEVIEHLRNPQTYVAEMRRVIRPGGTLILSTPNKRISSPTPGSMWPHHVHEFYPDELQGLLESYFGQVEMWGLSIPVYDTHPLRRLAHGLAPVLKPLLPLSLRVRALPTLQGYIKQDLAPEDVVIAREAYAQKPTLMAVCGA